MGNSRSTTKRAVIEVLAEVAPRGPLADFAVRLVEPMIGADLGIWKVTENNDIASFEIDESGATASLPSVNVALTNVPKSVNDRDTNVSVVVNNSLYSLVRRDSSTNWVYLTRDASVPVGKSAEATPPTESAVETNAKKSPKKYRLKPSKSAQKLAVLASENEDYSAESFLDPAFTTDDELLNKSLAYVRSKLFGLNLLDDDLIFLLDSGVILRNDARNALKWNAFVRWATPIINKERTIPDSVSGERPLRFMRCLTRTARTEERIWPKEHGTVVQFSGGIDLNSFLRGVNDDWYEGNLTSTQVDFLNQVNFMISNTHASKFNMNQVKDLFEIINHVSNGGSIDNAEESLRRSTLRLWQNRVTSGDIDESLLLVFAVLGIGPAYERKFHSRNREETKTDLEASLQEALDGPTSGQNASDGSESGQTTQKAQGAVRRPAARKDQPKPESEHRSAPFGASLLGHLTEGSSRDSVARARRRAREE